SRITKTLAHTGLSYTEIEAAGPGDICSIAGLGDVTVGETIASAEDPRPLPVLEVDEPTLRMTFGVNTSPMSGREGKFVTSRHLKARLDREILGNVSIRLVDPGSPDRTEVRARGLIGFRSEMLTETRGTAVIHSVFAGYEPWAGEITHRVSGVLAADKPGVTTSYALYDLQERGEMFVGPGVEVYEGMIIGENAKDSDLDVNVVREKKLTNMRASTADEAIRLVPFRQLNLEQAIEFIADDEFVEVTPKSLRLRKKILQSNKRKKSSMVGVGEAGA